MYLHFSFTLILTFVLVSWCLYADRRDDLPPAVRSLKPLLFLLPHCKTNRDFLMFLFNALRITCLPGRKFVMTVHP